MSNGEAPLPRSFLYVPATRPELFEKAAGSSTDAILLDLEDSLPVEQKECGRWRAAAYLRASATEALARSVSSSKVPERWVRLNADSITDDLEAVVHPGLAGVFLAKCSAQGLAELAETLGRLEPVRGVAFGHVRVVGLVEDAATIARLPTIVASPRLTTLGVGEVDLLADLRMARAPSTASAVDALRLQVVVHCASAGLLAPVAPTSTDFRDLDVFAETTRYLHDLGFGSRTAIHPAQVPVVNDILTPRADTVAQAQDVVARFEAAAECVTTDEHGRMIDTAVVRQAREVLSRVRD